MQPFPFISINTDEQKSQKKNSRLDRVTIRFYIEAHAFLILWRTTHLPLRCQRRSSLVCSLSRFFVIYKCDFPVEDKDWRVCSFFSSLTCIQLHHPLPHLTTPRCKWLTPGTRRCRTVTAPAKNAWAIFSNLSIVTKVGHGRCRSTNGLTS